MNEQHRKELLLKTIGYVYDCFDMIQLYNENNLPFSLMDESDAIHKIIDNAEEIIILCKAIEGLLNESI